MRHKTMVGSNIMFIKMCFKMFMITTFLVAIPILAVQKSSSALTTHDSHRVVAWVVLLYFVVTVLICLVTLSMGLLSLTREWREDLCSFVCQAMFLPARTGVQTLHCVGSFACD